MARKSDELRDAERRAERRRDDVIARARDYYREHEIGQNTRQALSDLREAVSDLEKADAAVVAQIRADQARERNGRAPSSPPAPEPAQLALEGEG